MTENNGLSNSMEFPEHKIKLYNMLLEQLMKYESTIWQIPTALVLGNFLAIGNFLSQPFPLAALAIFNFGLIFVFYRMIKAQEKIITAVRGAEEELRKSFSTFLPNFSARHKVYSPRLFTIILWLLELGFVIYIVTLFLSSPIEKQSCISPSSQYNRIHNDNCRNQGNIIINNNIMK